MKPLWTTRIVIRESPRVIYKRMMKSLMSEVNHRFHQTQVRSMLISRTQFVIRAAIEQSAEYESLTTWAGTLRHELGLTAPHARIDRIVKHWTKNIYVSIPTFRASGTKLIGTIAIRAIPSDWSEVLNMDAATYLSTNKQGKETPVPWLEWLLTRGRSFVVRSHVFIDGSRTAPWSRTGDGIMVKKGRVGIGWQMPSEFAGTKDNNWITRAILQGGPGGRGVATDMELMVSRILHDRQG